LYCAAAIAGIMCITNFCFWYAFSQGFRAATNRDVWKKPKELRTENDFKDPEFMKHIRKYKKTNRCLAFMTMILSFKSNKMWYSAFFGYGNFITIFSHRRRYEKLMICFCVFHMLIVDLLLIAVDVNGIMHLISQSQ